MFFFFQTIVKELQVKVKDQKEIISKKNKEIQEAMHRKEVLLKELAESELQCTSLQHNLIKCQSDAKESKSKVCIICLLPFYTDWHKIIC